MTLIISASGFQSSGKDTFGNFLVENCNFTKLSFSKSLKDSLSTIFNWDRDLLDGNTPESRVWREQPDIWWENKLDWNSHQGRKYSNRFTPRIALQLFGTEIFRNNFHDNIWVLSLESQIKDIKTPIIITDCRFPNELVMIRNNKGITVRIKRGNDPEWFDIAKVANENKNANCKFKNKMKNYNVHYSEWAWIGYNFDYVINNDDNLVQFKNKIEKLMKIITI